MQIVTYRQESGSQESLDNFLDLYFTIQMKYFASDLLLEGLSAADITEAVNRAIAAAASGGLEVRRHFNLTYSQLDGVLVKDCQLSRLGYSLVMLNARPGHPKVGELQLRVLRHFLQK